MARGRKTALAPRAATHPAGLKVSCETTREAKAGQANALLTVNGASETTAKPSLS